MSPRQVVAPSGWQSPSGYAHGVSADGRIIAIAGQVGWNPRTGQFESDDFAQQTAQALKNIQEVLQASNARPEHIVRLTWFVTSRDEYINARKAIGVAYKEVFGRYYPAMSVVVVSALIETRAKVEIEATAVVPS